jgi:hypothetical protein
MKNLGIIINSIKCVLQLVFQLHGVWAYCLARAALVSLVSSASTSAAVSNSGWLSCIALTLPENAPSVACDPDSLARPVATAFPMMLPVSVYSFQLAATIESICLAAILAHTDHSILKLPELWPYDG